MNKASNETILKIRKIAVDPKNVRLTEKAKWGLMGSPLNKLGLCDEIINWIISGQNVREGETAEPPEHKGKIFYTFKPKIEGVLYYIRFSIEQDDLKNEWLLIISMHPDT